MGLDEEMQQEIDIISSLPESLLHSILSFLPTKESVRTSVLSKRWISVWKSVPRLDLNFSDFNQVEIFEHFAHSVLHSKISPNPERLDTFNLTWKSCTEDDYESINTWIYNLVALKPKEVSVDVSKLDSVYFCSYLFDCASIERLFLWAQIRGAWSRFDPAIVDLPFLKRLDLGWVSLEDVFVQRLVSGCPVLEELSFDNCCLGVSKKIMCFSLKKLVIRNTVFGPGTFLRVCMPNLEYLSCQVHLGLVDFDYFPRLEHAVVNLYEFNSDYDSLRLDDLDLGFKLLKSLSNAKSLQLSRFFVKNMLEKEVTIVPIFEKLESLDLISFIVNDALDPVESFLRKTPNLKKLILQYIWVEDSSYFRRFLEFKCESSIKTVEIFCLKSDKDVDRLVKTLVAKLVGLDNILINRTDEIDESYGPKFTQYNSDEESDEMIE